MRERVQESVYEANQWQLMWRSFIKHRLAVIAGIILVIAYLSVIFTEFIAPYDPEHREITNPFVPPMRIRINTDGKLHGPSIYQLVHQRNPETLMVDYRENQDQRSRLLLFVRGDRYKMWGVWWTDVHLFGTDGEQRFYLLGTDKQGRDMFSRIIYGTRLSLSVGLIGVTVSFILAIILGCISGYFGGISDMIIQRIIEVLTSLPHLPLWMALAVAIPINWPITRVFFAITIILSLISWPGLARQVRGKILQIRDMEYIVAGKLDNAKTGRLLGSYLIPAIMSHLIASITLAIPGMILGETSLSFLGIGLRPPAISWGVLLQNAQNTQTVVSHPWLILPVLPVIIVILCFNFLGDGLRDAADPYKSS